MKLVVQRVKKASVKIVNDKKISGAIKQGLLVLLGIGEGDSTKEADLLTEKLLKLRIMGDTKDKMNLSVKDVGGEILVVSQFTLYADISGGNRPSFVKAAKPENAKHLYQYFVERLKASELTVETGEFGEHMEIKATLDGPVTIIM